MYSPHHVERSLNQPDMTDMSMFVRNRVESDHFEVVRTIIP